MVPKAMHTLLNLHDSGVDVVVGVREGGASWKKAEAARLESCFYRRRNKRR